MLYVENETKRLWKLSYRAYRNNRVGWGYYYKKRDFLARFPIRDEEDADVALFVLRYWQKMRTADIEAEYLWYGFRKEIVDKLCEMQIRIMERRAKKNPFRKRKPRKRSEVKIV